MDTNAVEGVGGVLAEVLGDGGEALGLFFADAGEEGGGGVFVPRCFGVGELLAGGEHVIEKAVGERVIVLG